MTLYARSDLVWVAPSRDHGGCGQGHGRPVENGAPDKVWALNCPQCETHLRHDDQWSVTISGIPETPDEKAEREEREKRGQQETTAATAEALQKLGIAVPELVSQGGMNQQMMLAMITALSERGVLSALPSAAGTAACASGHKMPPTAKFCPECGAAQQLGAQPADEAPQVSDEPTDAPDFESMTIRDLQAYATERGIKTTRAKADQIRLITETQS